MIYSNKFLKKALFLNYRISNYRLKGTKTCLQDLKFSLKFHLNLLVKLGEMVVYLCYNDACM